MKAIIIGATGLIGKALVNQLLIDKDCVEIIVISRKAVQTDSKKIKQVLVNFDKIEKHKNEIVGDVLFSTLGTTLKTAGSKEKQYTIDYHYQFNTAKLAHDNGVKKLVLLSSAGANAKSRIFYSKMKGELDDAVQALNFENCTIIRPSMLVGKREEFRLAEKLFTPVMYILYIIPFLRKYRPIKDFTVAKAMINAAKNQTEKFAIAELNQVFDLAKN